MARYTTSGKKKASIDMATLDRMVGLPSMGPYFRKLIIFFGQISRNKLPNKPKYAEISSNKSNFSLFELISAYFGLFCLFELISAQII